MHTDGLMCDTMMRSDSVYALADCYSNHRSQIIPVVKCFDQLDLVQVLTIVPDVDVPIRELWAIMPKGWLRRGGVWG